MPLVEACGYKKNNQIDKYALLQKIQSSLDNKIEKKIFLKSYRQWFQKIIPFKSIAFIIFDSANNHHVIYDFFPEDFQVVIKQQLEDGIIFWAGQNKQIFVSDQKIFVPLHHNGNYIGIIEIVSKNELDLLDNEVKILLEIVGNLIADHFGKIQNETEVNSTKNIQDSELYELALVGAISHGVIHDISNPLTSVVGRTGLLLNNKDKLQINLEIIEREAVRVSAAIHEFLAITTKLYKKEQDQEIQLNEVIRKSISFLSYYAKSKQVKIVLNLNPNISKVSVNYYRLLRFLTKLVFSNLILINKPQTLQIGTFFKPENDCVEIEIKFQNIPFLKQVSTEFSVIEKNGKIIIQLPVLLETGQSFN